MDLADILVPDRVACGVEAGSKKRALEKLSALIASAESTLGANQVFDCLIARERLGSTGLGAGVALPHGRMKHGDRTLAAFIRVGGPIDFDAMDQQPVDLLFALLVPEQSTDEHLRILARLAEMFSDGPLRESLRTCESSREAYESLVGWRPGG